MSATAPLDRRWHRCLRDARRHLADGAGTVVLVDVASQRLLLVEGRALLASYPVSTSRFGLGCRQDSRQTPTGWHRVEEMIGAGAAPGTVFRGRRDQGRTAEALEPAERIGKDLITSRILWLRGLEPGVNAGPGCDSHERYIYIHGTADSEHIGRPASIGCVRMLDADVIELFDRVAPGTPVFIGDPGPVAGATPGGAGKLTG